MKFPFDFSLTLIFRLVFPGMVLAIALLPFITAVLGIAGIAAAPEFVIPIAAVVISWLIVLLDQPVYMLFEGRRYWPEALRKHGIVSESIRLSDLLDQSRRLRQNKQGDRADEIDIMTLDFPWNEDDGLPCAPYPTRMGNLITAFESYPSLTYGVDAIVYWPRLWLKLDKDVRDLVDQQAALADSAVYVTFALTMSSAIFSLYVIGCWLEPYLPFQPVTVDYLPSPIWTLLLAIILAAAARILYFMCLSVQRTYGDIFRSLFDQYREQLKFVDDVLEIVTAAGGGQAEALDRPYQVAARMMRWHEIRPPGADTNCTPEALSGKDGKA